MFTQTRTNLKIIGTILFAITFLVGGFFINTTKASAEQSFQLGKASSYTMSSYTNNAGGVTTVARVGCDPQTGDKYDINTGKICSYATTSTTIVCATGSGDKYDINTGKLCAPLVSNVRIGCAAGSIDKYDINTGNHCTNNTPIVINKSIPTETVVKTIPNITATNKTAVTNKDLELATVPNNSTEILPTTDTANQLSGRETLGNSLTTSVKNVGSIITSPRSIWIILLIILILLGGGYAIYSLTKNNKKIEVKKIITEPIIQHNPITPAPGAINPQYKAPNPQVPPLNTTPQNKIPDTPLTHSQVNTPNPQIPLNIPPNPNPNPQANPQNQPF